jgi:hypothetical protein
VNIELNRAVKQTTRVLGAERTRDLLGLDENESADLVSAEPLLDSGAEVMAPRVRQLTEPLIQRYAPVKTEQERVSRAVSRLDPQRWHEAFKEAWGRDEKYRTLLDAIYKADEAYHHGDLRESALVTERVLSHVEHYDRITDEPFYLVSWAFHLGGRAHEKLRDLPNAELFYKASLDLKFILKDWLPPLALIATEIKLGTIEVENQRVEGLFNLTRLEDFLSLASRRLTEQNAPLYRNLLVDLRVALADALLMRNRRDLALGKAEKALADARAINDLVAESKLLIVIAKAKHQPLNLTDLRADFDRMSWPREEWPRRHPDVTPIWQQLEWCPMIPTKRWKAQPIKRLRRTLKRAAKKK